MQIHGDITAQQNSLYFCTNTGGQLQDILSTVACNDEKIFLARNPLFYNLKKDILRICPFSDCRIKDFWPRISFHHCTQPWIKYPATDRRYWYKNIGCFVVR